jgi:hypothetical protein
MPQSRPGPTCLNRFRTSLIRPFCPVPSPTAPAQCIDGLTFLPASLSCLACLTFLPCLPHFLLASLYRPLPAAAALKKTDHALCSILNAAINPQRGATQRPDAGDVPRQSDHHRASETATRLSSPPFAIDMVASGLLSATHCKAAPSGISAVFQLVVLCPDFRRRPR